VLVDFALLVPELVLDGPTVVTSIVVVGPVIVDDFPPGKTHVHVRVALQEKGPPLPVQVDV